MGPDSESGSEAALVVDRSDSDALEVDSGVANIFSPPASAHSSSDEGAGLICDAASSSDEAAPTQVVASQVAQACDSFRWAFVVLAEIWEILGSDALRSSLLCAPLRLSAHFSGVGSVEVAASMLVAAAPHAMGTALRWVFAAACEVREPARQILERRCPAEACLFRDIMDACPSWHVAPPKRKGYNIMRDFIMGCDLSQRRRCARHNDVCRHPQVQGDIAGSPCTPWSAVGTRLGREHSLTHLIVMWCAWVRRAGLLWALHENVRGFDGKVLEELLGDQYNIVLVCVNPEDCGFTCLRRPRQYHILYKRGCVHLVRDIPTTYAAVCLRFRRAGTLCLSAFHFASPSQLLDEENRARRRREYVTSRRGD